MATINVNPYTGTKLSSKQQESLAKQKAQLGETKFNAAMTATRNSQAAKQVQQDMAKLAALKANNAVPNTLTPTRASVITSLPQGGRNNPVGNGNWINPRGRNNPVGNGNWINPPSGQTKPVSTTTQGAGMGNWINTSTQGAGMGNWINTSTQEGRNKLIKDIAIKNAAIKTDTSAAFKNASNDYSLANSKIEAGNFKDTTDYSQDYDPTSFYTKEVEDILNTNKTAYNDQTKVYNDELARLEVLKAGVGLNDDAEIAARKAEIDARYKQQLLNAQMNAQGAKEETATRFAFSGFGRSSSHVDEQAALARQAMNIENEIQRAQLLEEQKAEAEVRGATAKELEGINKAIESQYEKVNGLKADFAKVQGELRLKALETGQTIEAQKIAEVKAEAAAKEKQRADYLKAIGMVQDPDTGELVADISARADLLKTQAEIEKIKAETVKAQQSGTSDYKLQFDPNTGERIIFDPNTGKVISGGVSGNAGVQVDDKAVQSVFYRPFASDYGHGVGKAECGEGYNDLTNGPKVGDSYASKMATVTKRDNPQIGNGLIIPYGAPQNGHIETVINKNGDTIKTVSWNRDGRGTQTTQVYSIAELNRKYGNNWGFNNSQLKPEYYGKLASASPAGQITSSAITGAVSAATPYIKKGMPALGLFSGVLGGAMGVVSGAEKMESDNFNNLSTAEKYFQITNDPSLSLKDKAAIERLSPAQQTAYWESLKSKYGLKTAKNDETSDLLEAKRMEANGADAGEIYDYLSAKYGATYATKLMTSKLGYELE